MQITRPLLHATLKAKHPQFGNRSLQQPASIQFGKTSSKKMSLGKRLMLGVPIMLASLTAGLASSVAGAQSSQVNAASECAQIMPSGDINSIDDLPAGIENNDHIVFDLSSNPLLSPEACANISQMLQENYNNGEGAFKVVVIENTERRNPQELNTEILNHLSLATPGNNDGGVLLIVQDRFVNNSPDKMHWEPADGVRNAFADRTGYRNSVGEEVIGVYLADIAREWDRGNFDEAQGLIDDAITKTMEITTERLEEHIEYNSPQAVAQREREAEEQRKALASFFKGLAGIVGGAIVVGGSGRGLYVVGKKKQDKNRRLDNDIDTVIRPLNSIASAHAVTRRNVHSIKTLKAVLSHETGVTNKHARPQDILTAMDLVISKLYEKNDPKIDDTIEDLLITEGLSHPLPEIRAAVISDMVEDGLSRDEDFDNFMTLLETEENGVVLDALTPPLLKLLTENDAPDFHQRLKESDNVGVRALSVRAIAKYPNDNTVSEIFDALAKEENGDLADRMRSIITRLSTASDASLLSEKLQHTDSDVVRAALEGISNLNLNNQFEAVFDLASRNKDNSLNSDLHSALSQLVTSEHQGMLASMLESGGKQAEKIALPLLAQLKSSSSVQALIDYLEKPDTNFSELAEVALVASAKQADRPVLLAELHSQDPKTEETDLMSALVKALQNIGNPDDIDDLTKAMERGVSSTVFDTLYEAMESSPHNDVSLAFLSDTVKGHADSAIRTVAALALDDYGIKALDPLFDALEGALGDEEKNVITKAILKAGRSDTALNELLARTTDAHPDVSNVATTAAIRIISSWGESNYQDKEMVKELLLLAQHRSARVAEEAKDAYNDLVASKLKELKSLGERGSFSRDGSDYNNVTQYTNDENISIKSTASKALDKMNTRRKRHEAEEARRAEEARLAKKRRAEKRRRDEAAAASRRAAARRRSASRSSSSGGFSGGGGSSSGGGGSSW